MMIGVLFGNFCSSCFIKISVSFYVKITFFPDFFDDLTPVAMGSYYQCSNPDSNEKKLDRSYPSIKHKQKWVWGDRSWEHFPSAGRKTCIWKVSVYSQLGDRHRNIVSVGLLLEQGTPWTGLSGAVKGGHHQYCKSTWSTQLICNIVNETDNPAGNLPDCTKCQWHKT